MITSNNGICLLCRQEASYRSMGRHLNKCLAIIKPTGLSEKGDIFLIKISSGKLFWLFLEINATSTLAKLDLFLRKIWLECCGHLSEFTIHGTRYASDENMKIAIRRLFEPGVAFEYIYDFGSTTELSGKIVSVRSGKLQDDIRLLARNHFPKEITCITCHQKPDIICSVCYDCFCQKCGKEHNSCEGEEFMLPVVNSPRMGICGYTGQD